MSPIRVLIADDHPLLREGVARSLAEAEGFEVSGQADTADDAVHQARDARPDVVLLDISMPGGGLSALRRIRRLEPAPLVAMLTVSEDDDDVMQALTAGAQGYILKGIGSRELVQIVRDLAAGRSYVSPSLAMKVLVAMNAEADQKSREHPIDSLTKREEDILRRVAKGRSNKEIGRDLGIQEKTVKHYMTTILGKLAVRNRTEAAVLAQDHWHG